MTGGNGGPLSPEQFASYIERRLALNDDEVEVLGRQGDTAILGGGVRADEAVVSAEAQVLLSAEFRRDTDDDD